MSKKQNKKEQPDDIPTLDVSSDVSGELVVAEIVLNPVESSSPRFVVVRDGLRVSDKEYSNVDEPKAIAEKDFWQKIVDRWPDGTKVEIVQYDKKKHRVW